MYPSQAVPARVVILKILQSKLREDQPGDLMELLNLALEVRGTFFHSDGLPVWVSSPESDLPFVP